MLDGSDNYKENKTSTVIHPHDAYIILSMQLSMQFFGTYLPCILYINFIWSLRTPWLLDIIINIC